MTCANCGCSLELGDRACVVSVVARDGDRLCGACANPGPVGGGLKLTREQIEAQVAAVERKYRPGGYRAGDAAAARGPKEAA